MKTDPGAARSASIDAAGGTVTTTGADGSVYTLTLPPNAVAEPTAVDLYPVTSLTNLPAGASLAAGIQFTPDGLQLHAPATLTIELPTDVDATKAVGIAWRGDGQRDELYPAIVEGRTVTMSVLHFSGLGLSPETVALALGCEGATDPQQM